MSTISITSPPKWFKLTYKSTPPPGSSTERLLLKSYMGLNAERF